MIAALVRFLDRLATGPARAAARRFGSRLPLGGGHRTDDPLQASVRRIEITWEEAEQLLTAGLLAGLIEQVDYQDNLELLARADDARSPLQVPPLHDS